MKPIISIIIPVYFNGGSLQSLFIELCKLEKEIEKLDMRLELIFVDDGSQDNSFEELLKIREQRPNTLIIKHSRNFGAPAAVRTGLAHSTGDCFTMLAADLQDPPDLILQMIEKWKSGALFTICERESREDPLSSRIFSWLYYRAVRFFVAKDFPIGGYDVSLMDKIFRNYMLRDGKSFYPPIFAWFLGFKPVIIKYHRQARKSGKSRWTFSKKLKAATDNILGYSFLPIRMMSFFGLIVALCSFIYGAIVFFNTVFYGREVPGFAALIVTLSFIQGVMLCMLGLIGEYIWRIYAEVNGKPRTVVEKIYKPEVLESANIIDETR